MILFDLSKIDTASGNVSVMPHLEALRAIPEYFVADVENSVCSKSGLPFKAAVFNAEQGTRLEKIIPFFQHHPALRDVDVILANELDCGMKRSKNIDTTRVLGKALGMNSVYGVEFITTKYKANGDTQALHGNAILSKYPLLRTKIIQLPIQFDWFDMPGDCRLGVRNAILAEIEPVPGKRVGLVSVHLENRACPAGRLKQVEYLLEQVEAHFGDIPVLIGGDMNTNTVNGNDNGSMDVFLNNEEEQLRRMRIIPQLEPLMDYLAANGYAYEGCNIIEKFTRRKPMPNGTAVRLNLDWFFQRGLVCGNPARVEAVFRMKDLTDAPQELIAFEGAELSDHDAITVEVTL